MIMKLANIRHTANSDTIPNLTTITHIWIKREQPATAILCLAQKQGTPSPALPSVSRAQRKRIRLYRSTRGIFGLQPSGSTILIRSSGEAN
jgi:hypothetical protein